MKANKKGKGKEKALEMDVDAVGDMSGTKKEDGGLIVLGKGSYLSVLEVFKNIAPIVDAALVDTDSSGQVSICSPLEIRS
jgi:DNA damage-binding protein 1